VHRKTKRRNGTYKPDKFVSTVSHIPSLSDTLEGSTPKKEPQVYSGSRKLLGIATMHKSNSVPIFEDAKEDLLHIAKMRR
jgi:hypothetical protein